MIKNLTGLRFFMAFWVVIFHVKEAVNVYIISDIINVGYLGVDVFFVLSGYILTYVYFDSFFLAETIKKENVLAFIKKRFGRIYPLHLSTLIGAILFLILLKYGLGIDRTLYFDHIIPQLFLVHAWGLVSGITWNFPSWSVSAEWFAYLFIFPLTYVVYRRLTIIGLLILVAITFIPFVFITNHYFENNIGTILDIGILRIIPEFLLGSAAYIWFWKDRKYKRTILLLYMVTIGVVQVLTFNFQYAFILLIPIFLIFLHKGNNVLNLLFGSKIMVFLGEISYSIYMLHYFSRAFSGIIQNNFVQESVENSIWFFINYTVLTIGLASLGYYLIEMPCRKYINSLHFKFK